MKPIYYRICLFPMLIALEFLATTTIPLKTIERIWDKANHLIVFAVITLLVELSFPKLDRLKVKLPLIFIFGLQIEIVQYFIPKRHFSILDLVANCLGIGAFYLFNRYLKRYLPVEIRREFPK